jgi:hypothetical protein
MLEGALAGFMGREDGYVVLSAVVLRNFIHVWYTSSGLAVICDVVIHLDCLQATTEHDSF